MVSFNITALSLVELLAKVMNCTHYIRRSKDRVDLMGQTTRECEEICHFFDNFPLQSYKQSQFLVWKKYVESISEDRFFDIQRKSVKKSGIDRTQYYIKLIKELDSLGR